MRFGINSFTFTDTFLDADLALFDHVRDLGFDLLEITPVDPDRFPASKVRQVSLDTGIAVNMNFALRDDSNPISPDPKVRQRSVDLSKRIVDLCIEAGAEIYGGANYCGWKYLTGAPRSLDEWRWGVECYQQVCAYAREQSSLVVAVETLNRFESHFINTAADAFRFVREVGEPNAKVHLDTFHMIREEDDLGGAIRGCGDRMGYFHACGSQRGIPGQDLVPWGEAITALRDIGYQDCITIESFHPDKSIAPLVAVWRHFADSPEQLASEGLAFLRKQVSEIYGADAIE